MKRSWWKNGSGCKEKLDVTKDGSIESTLAENWTSQVEEFFPNNISHLFLFDGEKIEAYASEQDSASLIGATIQNLLGLDVVDRLQKDLQVYEQRKRSEVKEDGLQEEILTCQGRLKELREKLESEKSKRESLSKRMVSIEDQLNTVSLEYEKLGGDLYDRQLEIEENLRNSQQELKDGENKLRELSSGALPLHLVHSLLKEAQETDKREENYKQAQQLNSVLHTRDNKLIDFIESLEIEKKLLSKIKKTFER